MKFSFYFNVCKYMHTYINVNLVINFIVGFSFFPSLFLLYNLWICPISLLVLTLKSLFLLLAVMSKRSSHRKRVLSSANKGEPGSQSKKTRHALFGSENDGPSQSSSSSPSLKKTPNRNLNDAFDEVETATPNSSKAKAENKINPSKRKSLVPKPSKSRKVKDADIQTMLEAEFDSESDLDDDDDHETIQTPIKLTLKVGDLIKTRTVTCSPIHVRDFSSKVLNGKSGIETPPGTPKRKSAPEAATPTRGSGTPSRVRVTPKTKYGTPSRAVGTPSRLAETPKKGTPSRGSKYPCPQCTSVLRSKHELEDHMQDDHDVYELSPDESPTPKKKKRVNGYVYQTSLLGHKLFLLE